MNTAHQESGMFSLLLVRARALKMRNEMRNERKKFFLKE
jgi:hypothetical protein